MTNGEIIKIIKRKQNGVEDLVKKSFLDGETQTQYLKYYNERLTMLNSI